MSVNTKFHEGARSSTKKTIEFDDLSKRVIGCAIEVHRHLGPGLLESVYQQCLAHELALTKLTFTLEQAIPVEYKGTKLSCGFRADLIIEQKLIVELKRVETLTSVHTAQILTHMKLSRLGIGLLKNFNVPALKHGVKRFVL